MTQTISEELSYWQGRMTLSQYEVQKGLTKVNIDFDVENIPITVQYDTGNL